MNTKPGFVAFALLAAPFVLLGETPTPTPKSLTGGAFAPGKSVSGVHVQQGRVQTDADWNEQLQTCRRQNEEFKNKLKMHANELEIRLHQLQADAEKVDENKKSSQDRNKAMRESIRKMLDKVADINRATRL